MVKTYLTFKPDLARIDSNPFSVLSLPSQTITVMSMTIAGRFASEHIQGKTILATGGGKGYSTAG